MAAEALGWPQPKLAATRARMLHEWLPGIALAAGPALGLRAFLDRAVAAGVRLAIISDYPSRAKLEVLGLHKIPWAAVVDASALGALKPLAAPFEAALAALGVPPERVLHVGDRFDCDVLGAHTAGMPAALRFEGRRAPSLPWQPAAGTFRDFAELLERLQLDAPGP